MPRIALDFLAEQLGKRQPLVKIIRVRSSLRLTPEYLKSALSTTGAKRQRRLQRLMKGDTNDN